MTMASGKQNASGALARAISAEVRAVMARKRVSGIQLSGMVPLSQNYIAKRLRDEAPFTINDIEAICDVLGEDFETLVHNATRDGEQGAHAQ